MKMMMNGNSMLTRIEYIDLKNRLNKLYDEVESIDKQIDMLILKRNDLINKVESGVAILVKYGSIKDT